MKNTNKKSISISGVCLILLTVLFGVGLAQAAPYTVTNTSDSGAGSLRQAVIDANAAGSDDVINFSAALSGQSIVLASEIVIANNGTLTINGLGANVLTINGGPGTNRIFYTNLGAIVTISGVTLTGGGGTGAFSGFGGAIDVIAGSLTLDRVHITGNTALNSGGVFFNGGTHQISNSTISSNIATNDCGGLRNFGGTLTVVNSTISGNSTAFTFSGDVGGGICSEGTTTLRSVTITGNTAGEGGGIFHNGTLNLGNTIVAGNTGVSGNPEIRVQGGTVTSAGYNLIGDNAGDSTNTNISITYQPTDIRDVNPLLAQLANNGGATQTHALLFGSPAIDKGNSFTLTTDQRGFARPVDLAGYTNAAGGNGADIGAFEAQTAPLAPTAATVSVSGRVITPQGRGIRNVVVTMTDSNGNTRTARTTSFGYYRFEEVAAGETYIFTVSGKRFSFEQNSQVHSIMEDTDDINFVANDQSALQSN